MSNTPLVPRAKTTTLAGLPVSGLIAIPSFAADSDEDDGGTFPYCCGITVIGSFGNGPLDPADYDDSYGWPSAGGGDNRKTLENYDYNKHKYTTVKNPDYNPSPLVKTKNLTKKEAVAWWTSYALDVVGTATLMATTVDNQKYARDHLLAAGWEEVVTFKSKGTGSIITVLRFTAEEFVRERKPRAPQL